MFPARGLGLSERPVEQPLPAPRAGRIRPTWLSELGHGAAVPFLASATQIKSQSCCSSQFSGKL